MDGPAAATSLIAALQGRRRQTSSVNVSRWTRRPADSVRRIFMQMPLGLTNLRREPIYD